MFFFKAKLLNKFSHSVFLNFFSILLNPCQSGSRTSILLQQIVSSHSSSLSCTALDYKWPVPLSRNIFFIWLQATHSHGFLPSSSSAALQSPLLLPPTISKISSLDALRAQFFDPYHAINSLSDPYGFKYPVINWQLSNLIPLFLDFSSDL